jgi:hypothetical protein
MCLEGEIVNVSSFVFLSLFPRYSLQDCLANRSQIAEETLSLATEMTRDLGVTITSIQIKGAFVFVFFLFSFFYDLMF